MSTAGYLQDAKNQQKRLAETITAKGITATATEKYKDLVDKVAQIENLKGEERTLENFSNVLSEPKSIVQLEYPEPKNLFDISKAELTNAQLVDGSIQFTSTNGTIDYKLPAGTYTISFKRNIDGIVYLRNGKVTSGYIATIAATGISATFTFTGNVDGYLRINSFTNGLTLSDIQIEKGTTATPYEPYPAPKTLNAKLGSKNLLNADDIKNTQNVNIVSKGNGACVIKLSSTNKITTIANLYKGHLPVGTYYFTAKLKIENTLGSTRDNEILVFYNNTVITRWYEANSGDGEYNVSKSFNVIDPSSEVRIDFYPTVNSSSSTPTTEYQATFTDIQLEYGNVATSYTPYISDLTAVNVTRCGKNLFDKNNANIIAGYINANVITAAYTSRCIYIPCNPNTTYTVSKIATARFVVAFTNVIPTAGTAVTNRVQNFTATSITATSGADSKYIVVWPYNSAYDTTTTIDEILATVQIELGSTATTYEPYQGQTYTPTATGEVAGITNLYPTTTLLTDNAGVIFEQVTGGFYKEILPSTDKNGITKVYQPSVDSTIDSNIKPENIKKGVKILGILGTYDGN